MSCRIYPMPIWWAILNPWRYLVIQYFVNEALERNKQMERMMRKKADCEYRQFLAEKGFTPTPAQGGGDE